MPAINPLAVVAAVIVAMVIGGIYYSPPLFGNRMMELAKAPQIMRNPGKAMGVQVVFSLVAMIVLAVLVQMTGAKGVAAGATVGFWAWLLVIMADAGQTNFSGRPWPLWLLNAGNWLLTFLVAGGVIGALS